MRKRITKNRRPDLALKEDGTIGPRTRYRSMEDIVRDTKRQAKVVEMIERGHSQREIALELGCTEKTVSNLMERARQEFSRDRDEAMARHYADQNIRYRAIIRKTWFRAHGGTVKYADGTTVRIEPDPQAMNSLLRAMRQLDMLNGFGRVMQVNTIGPTAISIGESEKANPVAVMRELFGQSSRALESGDQSEIVEMVSDEETAEETAA